MTPPFACKRRPNHYLKCMPTPMLPWLPAIVVTNSATSNTSQRVIPPFTAGVGECLEQAVSCTPCVSFSRKIFHIVDLFCLVCLTYFMIQHWKCEIEPREIMSVWKCTSDHSFVGGNGLVAVSSNCSCNKIISLCVLNTCLFLFSSLRQSQVWCFISLKGPCILIRTYRSYNAQKTHYKL